MTLLKKIFYSLLFIFCLIFTQTCWAVEITSPFGWRIHPIDGEYKFHTGIDLGYGKGDLIPAMLPGKVVYAAPYGGYGNCLILEHANGDHTLYGHCSVFLCQYMQYVERGQAIARAGDTGYCTGPHLHLEYWKDGQYVDPLCLFEM
jgi:murein DD-endopeptidase MepM/ murein hydrolase activator NlpD